ncbi:hypothetical protein E5983_04825 [Streptococcus danieliae]|uniref:Uncharacterized protein n=1 Tax=Streptococcus danieliae TaxID=747656 RepID=A0A7X3G8H8_9STRE|nr:hypothetical protein [Streptococcus danieliae]MVX58970.1 hypothetical protein [Streptococcus danieliae]
MAENRFAQLKETFEQTEQKPRTKTKVTKKKQNSPASYNRKGRYIFSLHEDVRQEKLEALVEFHQAKSASDYLEKMILKEYAKIQKKLK